MKKNQIMKRALACLMVVLMTVTAVPLSGFVGLELPEWSELFATKASAATEGYLAYEVEDGEAKITDCDTSISGELVIPDTLGGYPVTSIGDEAFYNCTGLTKINWNAENVNDFPYGSTIFYNAGTSGSGIDVVFGDNVKRIPANAFYISDSSYSPKIKSVTIGNSVTSIGDHAFNSCTGLTSVTIGNSVTSIGFCAFCDCTGLTNITIPDSVTSIGGSAFYNTAWYKAKPDGDVYVGKFYYRYKGVMPKNTSIVIQDGTKGIADSAFYYCTGLTSVTIPETVTSIGTFAFDSCAGLTSITIPDSVTRMGNYAFNKCTGLTSVTISDSVTSISAYAFKGCAGLTSVTIPDSVTSIGDEAFYNCTGLTSVTIPDSVTSIGSSAFRDCTGLTKINWNAESVSDFSEYGKVFYNAGTSGSGTDVVFGDNVKRIPAYAFYVSDSSYRPKIKSVTIGNSVTSIGSSAFRDCTGLTKINWNAESVSDFSEYGKVFYNAGTSGSGTDVVFGDNVKRIPAYAFYVSDSSYRPKIKSVTIGNSVTSIGNSAFRDCTGLTSVAISDSVTSIGDNAFYNTAWYNAQSYGDVYVGKVYYRYKGTMPENTSIVIKDGTKGIADSAFYYCSGLTSISIPDSVTSIGDDAFYYTAWYNAQPYGDVYVGKVYYKYKGEMPENTSIVIKDGTKGIADSAFYNCTGLASVTIPDSVTSIDVCAFYNCTGLTSVIIGNSLASIGILAFSGCAKLKDVYYNGSEEQWKAISIPEDNEFLLKATIHFNCDPNHTHSYVSAVTKSATCTENGTKTFTCSCGKTYTETIPATGHNFKTTTVAATCTSNGYETKTCLNCGETQLVKSIPATGHKYVATVTKPTCTADGYTTHKCSVCADTYTDSKVAAKGHTYVTTTTKATTSKDGKIVTACTACGKISKTTPVYKASSVKLSRTSFAYNGKVQTPTVTVKDSKGNTLKNGTDYTVKYDSGRKNIGKYSVTVTFKGDYTGNKKLSFNIILGKTAKLTATQTTSSVKATWKAVTGADGYKVTLYSAKNKAIKTVYTTKTTASFTKLSKGTTYKVRVTAYKTVNGKKASSSVYAQLTTATKPGTPTLKVTAGTGKAALSWNKQTGATGYVVYMATSKNGKYTKIATLKGNTKVSFTKTGLTKGKTYYFKVAAYETVGGKTVYGSYSSVGYAKIK